MRQPADEALVNAVYGGDVAGVRRALAAGADANLVVQAGMTVLMEATSAPGDTQIVRMLVARGARLDATDEEGRTPLHYAAMAGRADLARLLLDRGAAADATSGDGKTALDLALHWLPVVEVLRGSLAGTPAARAAAARTLEVAAAQGEHATVWKLLAQDPERTALTAALLHAARRGDMDVGRGLLDAGAEAGGPAGLADRPLEVAAWYGRVEFARLLLERGADPSGRDGNGWTALHAAARTGEAPAAARVAVTRLLLEAGADPMLREVSGYTPRLAARAEGRLDLVALLPPHPAEPPEDLTARGIARARLAERHDVCIDYRPNDAVEPFQVAVGPPRDATGMAASAAVMWARFRGDFEAAGAGWFLPLLERMAGGERVSWAEVAGAYRQHHGRAPDVHPFPAG